MDSSIAFLIFAAAMWAAWRRGPARRRVPVRAGHAVHGRSLPPPRDQRPAFVILGDPSLAAELAMTPANAMKLNALALYAIAAVLLVGFLLPVCVGRAALSAMPAAAGRVHGACGRPDPDLATRPPPGPLRRSSSSRRCSVRPSPRARCFCISCRATRATARRCSATTFTPGRFSASSPRSRRAP